MVTGLIDKTITADEYIKLTIEEKINFKGKIRVFCSRCNTEFLDENKNIYNFDVAICKNCNTAIFYSNKKNKSILNCPLDLDEILYYLNKKNPATIEAELYLNITDKQLLLEVLRYVDGKCDGHINLIM